MATKPTRRSPRILKQSSAANQCSTSSSLSNCSTKSSSTRSKRKPRSTASNASCAENLPQPLKKRRLDASIYTIRSEPDPKFLDPVAVVAARKSYLDSLVNPLYNLPIWGNNPYDEILKGYRDVDPKVLSLPPMEPAPQMKRLRIRYDELTLVEVIRDWDEEYEHVNSIFRVKYKGKLCILKVFRSSRKLSRVENGMMRYKREKRAYERLLQHGVCSEGFVPMCYGWFKLHVPEEPGWLRSFAGDKSPPLALLIEHIPDTVQLNVSNITVSIAEQAMLAAEYVHGAGVVHNDLDPHNTLIRPDGTVVIIDFDMASTWPDKDVNRFELKDEMAYCWNLYYTTMLTDQLTGLSPEDTLY
ncbi:hypothetical protein NEOLEDRAFT_1134179 [Neolentinus lepideus HHB14362 ss-1]|uniref:Protein kinase domain-containing protein n=1 Tax=Neolentinus lepideus HHB14362 ss-1 TaxID=1314782 RepID=A0A165SCP8_9AGAM|nr:hypothetical protein NEOLEDRAFT_1134179 [Neolentinus lepideus HHB14362 ss-1]